jgi:hypothetical protein
MGNDVLFSLMMPTTTCAEKIHESAVPMRTMLQRETLARVEGVRVCSIWRTRRTRTRSWVRVAKAASAGSARQSERAERADIGRWTRDTGGVG